MDKNTIWQIARVLWRPWAKLPGKCKCIVCERSVNRFLPYKGGGANTSALMKELQIIGSDVDHFECPSCGSTDRERHLIFFLTRLDLFDRMLGARVLHMAPERNLSDRIRKARPLEYVLGDLFPQSPEVRQLDLQKLPFEGECFDFVVANHVLEHVGNDELALMEIVRVLKKGGFAILQTPYSDVLENRFEDAGIRSERARLHAYGQEDHVRLYGKNWVSDFERAGLSSRVKMHQSLLPDVDAKKFGVNKDEPFMLFERM